LPGACTLIAGTAAAALGLVVIVGWHTQNSVLIRVSPAAAPMSYNSALAFLLCGAGLLLAAGGRPFLARAAGGGGVTALAAVTLSQYLFGVDFGIDQAFVEDVVSPDLPWPGRMALTSALNFTLAGVALLLVGSRARFGRRPAAVGMAGTVILVFGLVTLILRLTGLMTPYGWGQMSQVMAVHTAAGFIVLGVGILGWAWREGRDSSFAARRWLPVLVGAGVAAASLCVWQALLVREHVARQHRVQLAAANIQHEITVQLDARLLNLVRLAIRWEQRSQIDEGSWKAYTRMLLRDFPGLQAICWIDPSLHVSWVWPLAEDAINLGFDAASEARRRSALEAARERRGVTISRALELPQKGKGFFISVPIFAGEQVSGFLSGVFLAEDVFDGILKGVAPGYELAISDGVEILYRRAPAGLRSAEAGGQEVVCDFYGVRWQIRVWPGAGMLKRGQSYLPAAVLGSGFVLALLLATTVALAQTAQMRRREAEAVNQELRREIATRRQVEERYRLLTESLSDALYVVDRDGRITFCTPALERLSGYTAEELLGRPSLDLYDPGVAPAFQERRQRALRGEPVPPHLECEMLTKDGRRVPVELAVTNFVDGGRITGRVTVARDVTARKRLEEALRTLNATLEQRVKERTAELARVNRELIRVNTDLRQFAYIAAHDLQEPLRMVITNTQLLARRYHGLLDAAADECVGYAVEGAKRMQRLILDLLAYSEIGMIRRAFTQVNCEEVLAGALADLRGSITEREAVVTNEPLPTVWGDAGQLRTVFRNLISNGIKFRHEEPPHVHIRAERRDNEWLFSVRDNGKGITPEYAERLFVVFERLHSQERYPKPGVGLAICRKIIEQHGGRIWAESHPGQGTTFRFTLPAPPPAVAAETGARRQAGSS
jgi:PAS domain S-box-containing protein